MTTAQRIASLVAVLALLPSTALAWQPDQSDLAAFKSEMSTILPPGYSVREAEFEPGKRNLVIEATDPANKTTTHRCWMVITLCPPMDMAEWKRLHEKQRSISAELEELRPKINSLPFSENRRKARNPEEQAWLDRLAQMRKEYPREIPDAWYRSLGVEFFDMRHQQPDDAQYLLGEDYKQWTVFCRTLDAVLQASETPAQLPKPTTPKP